mgnify:CR=1 FL=1
MRLLLACPLGLVAMLLGCASHSTITFEVADVINAWDDRDDNTASMLEVDILLLTPADVASHPAISRRKLLADEWFRRRDAGETVLPPAQVLALRSGEARPDFDTRVGDALVSARDQARGSPPVRVAVRHPTPGEEEAAIAIYARYSTESGLARNPPLIIQPVPGPLEPRDILVKVGRRQMYRGY